MTPKLFNFRTPSLIRGNILVFGSVFASIPISGIPHLRANLFLMLPAIFSLAGMVETIRCIRPRWSLYHAGVMLFLYSDLVAISFIFFLLLYPYFLWISATH